MVFELSLKEYKGPLETLLDLVLEKKMEITLVSLADVTSDFLNYVAALEEQPEYRGLVADFLVIASKLIFIKSKVLLPSLPLTQEEEADIQNLELRLKFYQMLKGAEVYVKEKWSVTPQIGKREFLMSSAKIFFPPKTLTPEAMYQIMQTIRGEFEKLHLPVEKVEREVINLKQKIQEVLDRISEPTNFNALTNGRSRTEIVVLFLAVLHLIKDQLLSVDQESHFSEMVVAKRAQNE